ncbi:protein GIGAS CELL1-like [Phragmites australis]|uniref:protein GIGAS CELL1-like n=1 Tax=Phragmites australis TaxID=29695 RepID=UPI002D791A94|nr:protein GIGAS CELL1-like [Phragmites australis]XP_062222905.1 protein GIGAS CELL1-like [Phragmites australis]XP_062222906.1 protein GIGAS CELL1-like [Phragmites australis]
MPEVRNASKPALADGSGGGFFIRRLASPGAVVVKGVLKPLARRARSPSNNKENVPPAWAVTAAPKRRSPLPDWYPRTPLRDITSIVKAVERRRRLSDAAARQQIQWTEDSSQSVDPTTRVQTEQGVPQGTPITQETLAAVTSGPGSTQVVASPATSLAEDKLKPSSSPSDCSLQTASSDLLEKKLSSSIEQIEKTVRGNLKETPKAAQPSKRVVQRRTLMSMR